MKKYWRKLIAPIIISILFVLYYIGITFLFLTTNEFSMKVKVLLIIVPLALAGTMIGALVSRIKEIRSGEEDDLSKY